MWGTELQLVFMLFMILAASILFTNALEHWGHRVNISAGVTGSIFAAIATALPETTIPIVALVAGTDNIAVNQEVGVGAILGAPLMISTLSTAMMALFALPKRGWGGRIHPEPKGFLRDLHFFLMAFILAAVAMYLPYQPLYWRGGCSVLLIALYVVYLRSTFKASRQSVKDGYGVVPDETLILTRLGLKDNKIIIGAQLLLGLVLLLWGARGFVQGIETISRSFHVSALLLSLLIVPIATELPEKINSILWIRKKKDTLAVGNLTGAMVFQGTLLPALGIMLASWQPNKEVFPGIVLTLLAAAWLRFNASAKGLRILALFVNGLLYLLYLYWVL